MGNLWDCAYIFPIREVYQLFFFFKELVVSLFPLVSVCSTADSLVCQKPLSSLLFSMAPRYSMYARFFWIIWDGIFYACFTVLFFHKGRTTSRASSPNCSELCRFLFAVLQVLWCFHELELFHVLWSPQAFKVCCSSSVLWDRWDRNHSSRQPPKKSEHWYIFHSSLSLPREKLQVGSFFLTVNNVRLRGRDWHGWNEMTSLTFSVQLFLALQYWDFLIGF